MTSMSSRHEGFRESLNLVGIMYRFDNLQVKYGASSSDSINDKFKLRPAMMSTILSFYVSPLRR